MNKILVTAFLLAFTLGAQASALPEANLNITPTRGDLETTFTLDASLARNTSGLTRPLVYQFKASSNQATSAFQHQPIFKFKPQKTGTFRAQLTVKDAKGVIQKTYRPYTVVNEIFRDILIKVDNPNPQYGEEVIMEAVVMAPLSENRSAIQFRWDFQGDKIFDTPFSHSRINSFVYQPGTTSPVVEVKFEDGSVLSKGVFARVNRPKIRTQGASITAPIIRQTPGGKTHPEGRMFQFSAQGNRDLKNAWIEWSFDGESFYKGPQALNKKFSSPGLHEIRVRQCIRVHNPLCEETTHTVTIEPAPLDTVFQIQAQNLRDFSHYQNYSGVHQGLIRATEGDRISVSASQKNVYTGRHNAYFYRWDFNGDGVWDTAFDRNSRAEHTYNRPGNYVLKLEARPERFYNARNFVSQQRNIVVDKNHKPKIDFTTRNPQAIVGKPVYFNLHLADKESQITQLETRFDLDGDGDWDSEFQRSTSLRYKIYDTPGTKKITIQVRDPQKKVTTLQKKLVVHPLPQTQVRIKVSHRAQSVGQSFSFNASESTGQGLQYTWKILELPLLPKKNGSRTSYRLDTPGQYTVCLRVLDRVGREQSVNIPLTVLPKTLAHQNTISPSIKSTGPLASESLEIKSPYQIKIASDKKSTLDIFRPTGMRAGL